VCCAHPWQRKMMIVIIIIIVTITQMMLNSPIKELVRQAV
jgi:hypothetical protein